MSVLITKEQAEAAIMACPVVEGVSVMRDQEAITRPLVHLENFQWYGAIMAVRKNGLPVWKPTSKYRKRRARFVETFRVYDDSLSTYLSIRTAALVLLHRTERTLTFIRGGRLAAKNRRARGWRHPGTGGRPPGKLAGHLPRFCRKCKSRHLKGPCPSRGTPRWPPE
jgi:hypothetical protein